MRTAILSLILLFIFLGESEGAVISLHSNPDVDLKLLGYNGQEVIFPAREKVPAEGRSTINDSYIGLGVLVFAGGQSYPVILRDEPLTLHIKNPDEPPSFTGSDENYFFSRLWPVKNQKVNNSPSPA